MTQFEDPRMGMSLTEYMQWSRKRKTQKHPMKRLIVCCDGTWQSANHGLRCVPSNIAKLSRAIAKYEERPDGTVVHQLVFYDAGVGTDTETDKTRQAVINKRWEGTFGIGLDENVCEGYNFLVNNYNPGDEIYLFGFSRGAYTARALAGLVCSVGLCTNEMMDEFWAMYAAYKKKDPDTPIARTEWGCQGRNRFLQGCVTDVKMKVVGVFDTVGALGWPVNTTTDVKSWNAKYAFHNTKLHPQIENAFHALALDEHRASFSPTLWSLPTAVDKDHPIRTKLVQCWFPGVHINIGGGSNEDGDLETMANITFAWMVDRVRESTDLSFDDTALHEIVKRYTQTIISLNGNGNQEQGYAGWGIGRIVDSYTGIMKAAGSIVRKPGQYPERGETREYIHPVVAYAQNQAFKDAYANTSLEYKSEALKGFTRVKNPAKPGSPGETLEGVYWRKVVSQEQRPLDRAFSYWWGKPQEIEDENPVVLLKEFAIPPQTAKFKSQERWLASVDLSPFVSNPKLAGTEERTRTFLEKLDRGD